MMIWYVNPKTGSDTNNGGSIEMAFRSLAHAVHAASAGDTVLLVPGAYDQDLPQQVSAARVADLTVSVLGGH
jgi:hypothetical protein